MSSNTKTTATKEEATPALVPKLRFPEFREAEGWADQAGDALFDQINDRNPEPGLPVLAITQEHGAIPRHMIDYHVSVTEKSIESYKVVQIGDFIISLRSFQGGIEYSRYHGICSPAYVILRRRHEGGDEYFRHYLKTDRFIRILTKNLEGLRDGKMVSYAQFSELLIPVPSPPEQQKIAACLSSVDELIAAQARNVDALKTHKKGLMQQLFPREGETQPRLRFPEFEDAGAWETRQLRQLTSKISDGIHATPIYDATGEYAFINGNNLADGRILINEKTKRINVAEFIKYKSPLDDRSILLSINGTIGNLAIFRNEKVILGKSACFININSGLVDKLFIYYSLQSDRIINFFNIELTGSTIKNLSLGTIKSVQLLVPPLPEQQRIADCLTSLDDLIAAQTQKLALLKTHKQGLMQQLFPASEAPTS